MVKLPPDPKPRHASADSIPEPRLPPKETKPTPGDPSETKTFRDLVDPKPRVSGRPDIPERYLTGGATSVYTSAPFERASRDVRTMTQHIAMHPRVMEAAGRVLFGLEPDMLVF